MAHLFTNHDPFHIHKILGFLVLLNFLYRFFLVATQGYAFVVTSAEELQNESTNSQLAWFDIASVLLHGCLSWSSLLLPLPQKRNFSSPMIWTEFRFHSILFASRSVIATIIGILSLWPKNLLANYISKLALVLSVGYIADWITAKFGSNDDRTTNSMPYPAVMTAEDRRSIKMTYALAQFGATLTVISENPTLSFFNLLAIQGAPLNMTLVRKGKLTALGYHKFYIWQLLLPTLVVPVFNVMREKIEDAAMMYTVFLLHFFVSSLRFHGLSKYAVWILGVLVMVICTKSDLSPVNMYVQQMHTSTVGLFIVTMSYMSFHCWRFPSYYIQELKDAAEDLEKDAKSLIGPSFFGSKVKEI